MGSFVYRPLDPDRDNDFLRTLYGETRADELAAWEWAPEQTAAFLRFQYSAQQMAYAAAMPHAEHRVVCAENEKGDQGEPIGRIIVDARGDELHLADISLRTDARNRGVGTAVLQSLQKEAHRSHRKLTLQVCRGSRAMRLYARLGFQTAGESDADLCMVWLPETVSSGNGSH